MYKKFNCIDNYILSFNDFQEDVCILIHTNHCNLDCKYCFNKEPLKKHKLVNFIDELYPKILKEIKEYRLNKNITISGGEPTLNPYLIDIIKYLYKNDWKINLYTNATNSDIIKIVLPYLHQISIDIKLPLIISPLTKKIFNIDNITNMIFIDSSFESYKNYITLFKYTLDELNKQKFSNIEFRTTFNDYLLSSSILSRSNTLLYFLKLTDKIINNKLSSIDNKVNFFIQKVIYIEDIPKINKKYTKLTLDINKIYNTYINKIKYKKLNIIIRQ